MLILASASPRRSALLKLAGVGDFRVAPADIDESVPPGLSPRRAVCLVARKKAQKCLETAGPDDLIVAADTAVFLDGSLLGKPADLEDAVSMLMRLSGRRHEVYTGVCAIRSGRLLCSCERTSVWFLPFDERAAREYALTGEPMDKAGAYGIQGRGSLLVARIAGDYFNVMGLPLCRLNRMLGELGAPIMRIYARSGELRI